MRSSKLWPILALVFALGLVASACGDDDSSSDGDAAASDDGDGGEAAEVVEDDSALASEDADPTAGEPAELLTLTPGVLTVCADPADDPYAFQDDAGEFTGFDIELLRTAATNLGLTVEVVPTPAADLVAQTAAGTCDLAASSLTIADAEGVVFSQPYIDGEQFGFAVAAGNEALATAVDTEVQRLRDNGDYDAIYADWFG